jgi:hypothetical protein
VELRPTTPTHAPLAETELADTLVMHPDAYKSVLDTIRLACANVESELAYMLAPHLTIPAEAKRALANLFAAPGVVHVNETRITIALQPAGTKSELRAFDHLLRECNRLNLVLPGEDSIPGLHTPPAQVSIATVMRQPVRTLVPAVLANVRSYVRAVRRTVTPA